MRKMLSLAAAVMLAWPWIAAAEEAEAGLNRENNARVFYEIFVGSFSDANGDGTGDLEGIIRRMDYLNDGDPQSEKSLGIEGIWLTPVFRSPSYHKYDVTDYYRIDPTFGTEEDLKELISLCHARDVKLILDLPLNHTGKDHAWFREFRKAHEQADENDPYYNWYAWIRDGDPVPSGRRFIPLSGTDILYECNFSDDMPELNYDNEAVCEAAAAIGQHWLQMGVDGFRIDAAKYIFLGETDRNVSFWDYFADRMRETDPDVYLVAEVWDGDAVTNHYAPAVNCFRFSASQAEGSMAKAARGGNINTWAKNLGRYLDTLREINPAAMHIPFIANHDTDRAAGYLPSADGKAAMAVNLLLLTPGSPFLYYGEEIGLKGSRGAAPTDANRRLAMRWGDGDTVEDPEGSDYPNQTDATVQSMAEEEDSLLKHYARVIRARRDNPEIARGIFVPLSFADTKAGGFLCTRDGKTVAVLHNPTKQEASLDVETAAGRRFTEIAAVLDAAPGQGSARLEEGWVILGPQTSVILR